MNEVIDVFHVVYNELGYGLPEHMYMSAMEIALRERNHEIAREVTIRIPFRGHVLGRIKADMLVNDTLFVEGKTGLTFHSAWKDYTFRYVRRGHRPAGLLLFFGPSPEFKRIVVPL